MTPWSFFNTRLRRQIKRLLTSLSFILLSLWASATPSLGEAFNEYELKAVFLFHFAQFVEWPAGNATKPFVIGILGDDPFGEYLDATVRGESIHGRQFVIERHRTTEDARSCDILFFSNSEKKYIKQQLENLKSQDILTVSDADNFARYGGMIQFVNQNKRVNLKINVEAAKAANLTISSKLLRPATIVKSEQN